MSSSSLVFRVLQPYLRCLERYPVRTKSITAAVVLGAGDVLSQSIERHNKRRESEIKQEKDVHLSHDFVRTAKMCSYGLILLGPVLHNWYKALNMLTRAKSIQNTPTTKTGFMHSPRVIQIKNGLKQTLVDQTTAGPFCVAMFMVYMTAVDGKNIVEKLERDYVNAMKIYYKIWPLIQFINFTFVPLHHRVLVVNTVSIMWNAILSHLQYGKVPTELKQNAEVSTNVPSVIQS